MKLLLTLILFIAFSVHAQNEEKVEAQQKALETAKQHINDLKNGLLLVRLDYKTKEITYYEEHGNSKEATNIREKQATVNKEIMNAFQKYYSFSPVYYFSIDDSRKLLDERYDEIQLLDQFGIRDTTINLRDHTFFVAEFGVANQEHLTAEDDSEFATKMSINALVIRDKNLVELRDPFPYHVKYSLTSTPKKRYWNPVKKWQVKLDAFLKE